MPSSIKIVPLILDLPFTILWILSFIIASYYSTSKNHLHLTDNRNRPANNVSRLHTLGVLLAWQVVVLTGVVWVKVLALVLRHVMLALLSLSRARVMQQQLKELQKLQG